MVMVSSGAAKAPAANANVATLAARAPRRATNFGMSRAPSIDLRSEKRPQGRSRGRFPNSTAYAELEGGPYSLHLIAYLPVKRTRGIRREKGNLLFRTQLSRRRAVKIGVRLIKD